MNSPKVLKIKISKDLQVRLKVLVQESGKSEDAYIKQILRNHMLDEEDLCLAESRLIEITEGKSKTYTLKQAMAITKSAHDGGNNC